MEVFVKREPACTESGCTLGKLYIDGNLQCLTLEDEVREVPGVSVVEWKIPKVTAIPRGRYKLIFSTSKRFKKYMPELINVPGFTGVRIHSGNTSEDTEGCLLVGTTHTAGEILGSRAAYNLLIPFLSSAFCSGEEIYLTIQ